MKRRAWYLIICLLVGSATWAQVGPKSGPTSQQEQSPQQDERPTLGPRNGPGLDAGPLTATTTDLRKLRRIRTLYVENIDNSLSDKLIEAIGKLGRFRLVTKAKDADAIMRGSCLESRRLKDVHTQIYISDRNGGAIWQDTIHTPFNPPALDKAVSGTAAIVVAHLEQSIRAAEAR